MSEPKSGCIGETFTGDEPSDRIQRSARDALRALREKKPVVPGEIIRLRETVDKLSKDTEMLRDDLEDMKNRLDAKEKAVKDNGGGEISE